MKNIFIALLMLFQPFITKAQKHNIYTDAGISLAYFDPGFSATYNYNLIRHIGIGMGAQAYVFHTTATNHHQFTPAAFADIRFRIRPKKISQYFVFMNLGMNFYPHNNNTETVGYLIYSVPNNNGTYFGLGIGYFLRLTTRGWGPYVTVKAINNFCKENEFNTITNEQRTVSGTGGTLVVSLGFRFLRDTQTW